MNLLHLGPYSDWVEAVRRSREQPSPANEISRFLEFYPWPADPRDGRIERTWCEGDIIAEEMSWSCGYGPRTQAWLYRPAHMPGPYPGIVFLHDHGAFKYWGKEKVADGPQGAAPGVARNCRPAYGDRSPVAALARAGFAVLVHDVFLWGSRRVPYETMPEEDRRIGRMRYDDQSRTADERWRALPQEVRLYNAAAIGHENTMAKYATILGTSLAGVVNFEDLVAVNYLRSRTDLCNGWIGCAGLSGGGLRSALLRATSENIGAAVIVGMMCTYAGILDRHLVLHTWMFYPPALARRHDWPEVVARNFETPVLVQYDENDPLFSSEGMHTADVRIRDAFAQAGRPDRYHGQFYPGVHKFDAAMQDDAIAWLRDWAPERRI